MRLRSALLREEPEGATGDDPTPVAALFLFGADLPVGGNGRLALDYSGELRKVTYSGTGDSDLAPEKATRTEVLAVVGLSFRYRF